MAGFWAETFVSDSTKKLTLIPIHNNTKIKASTRKRKRPAQTYLEEPFNLIVTQQVEVDRRLRWSRRTSRRAPGKDVGQQRPHRGRAAPADGQSRAVANYKLQSASGFLFGEDDGS